MAAATDGRSAAQHSGGGWTSADRHRNGVFAYSVHPGEADLYLDPDLESEYGFTQATFGPGGVWACHRDGGVVSWRSGEFARPSRMIRPSELGGGAKFIARSCDSSQLIFAVNERVLGINSAGEVLSLGAMSSPIVAVLCVQDQVVIAAEDGTITICDGRTFERLSETRPVGRLSGASVMPWLSSSRLLLTTPDGPIYCIGLDDPLVTQYASPHVGARDAASSAAKVAAMSPDRQRILIWNAWDTRRPAGEIYITGLTKHRVADIAFG